MADFNILSELGSASDLEDEANMLTPIQASTSSSDHVGLISDGPKRTRPSEIKLGMGIDSAGTQNAGCELKSSLIELQPTAPFANYNDSSVSVGCAGLETAQMSLEQNSAVQVSLDAIGDSNIIGEESNIALETSNDLLVSNLCTLMQNDRKELSEKEIATMLEDDSHVGSSGELQYGGETEQSADASGPVEQASVSLRNIEQAADIARTMKQVAGFPRTAVLAADIPRALDQAPDIPRTNECITATSESKFDAEETREGLAEKISIGTSSEDNRQGTLGKSVDKFSDVENVETNESEQRLSVKSDNSEYENKIANDNLSEDSIVDGEKQTRAAKSPRFKLTLKLCGSTSPEPASAVSKARFACDQCSKTFKFTTGLDRHTKKCHGKSRKFQCDTCSMVFVNKTLLTGHILSHLGIKPAQHTRHAKDFKRSQTARTSRGFSSKSRQGLKRHAKVAHSFYSCTICNYKTASLNSIRVHAVLHVASKATACIVCGAAVKKRTSLIEHLMGHIEDMNLTCKVCKKKFSTSHEYLMHLFKHRDSLLSGQQSERASPLDLTASGVQDMQRGNIPGLRLMKRKGFDGAMDISTMETRIARMGSAGSKLAELSKSVSFLEDRSKVVSQLKEISELVSELTAISSKVLTAFENACNSGSVLGAPDSGQSNTNNNRLPGRGRGRRSAAAAASKWLAMLDVETNEVDTHQNIIDGEDTADFFLMNDNGAVDFDIAATVKEELEDSLYIPSEDLSMQIEMDLKGERVTRIKKEVDIPLKPESFREFKDEFGKRRLQCTHCQQVFNDTRSLKRHVMVHEDIRPYSCSKCSQSFKRREHLKKHMVTHSDDRPFKCSQCPYMAKTAQRLKIHAVSHAEAKPFACSVCSHMSKTKYQLKYHMKKHQTQKCTQCDFVCYSRVELKKHIASHTTLSCQHCEFSTSDRAEYAKHSRKHSEFRLLCCELCGYSCNTLKKFNYHKLRHENKTPFQCPDCDYKCSSRASFDCHRLKHAGLKPFLCTFCGASFRKTSHLNQHMLIHKDEKAYKCSKCGYRCRTKHNLKEHEMTHSGEKPYSCKYCNLSFRRKKAMLIHMAKHEIPSEPSVAPTETSLQVEGPPPYRVNLSIPLMPPLPSMQMSSHLQLLPSSMQNIQMPLQMPMMPSGL